jgi:hypothetical protein
VVIAIASPWLIESLKLKAPVIALELLAAQFRFRVIGSQLFITLIGIGRNSACSIDTRLIYRSPGFMVADAELNESVISVREVVPTTPAVLCKAIKIPLRLNRPVNGWLTLCAAQLEQVLFIRLKPCDDDTDRNEQRK